ncbi:MAG: trypsin-like peptidase domain-containing protein [Deltaproteobacteria bacterium]|nr:trypsin-like peptidase domain-containing protein [Deltaproteobacteria bacterium]
MSRHRRSGCLWLMVGKGIGPIMISMSVAIVGWLLFYSLPPACAEEVKAKDLYERARPAVLMVSREFKCTITVPRVNVDDDLFDQVKSALKKSGEKKSARTISDAITQEFKRKPSAYIERSPNLRDFEATFKGGGSGFLATSRGHIITNAHVVNLQWADVLDLVKNKYMARDCLRLIRQMQSQFRELNDMTKSQTETMIEVMFPGMQKFYKKYTQLKWTRTCRAVMRFVDANSDVQLRDYPAEVIKVGRSAPGKDVAVLKIDVPRLPACLPLGDESSLSVGDQIYVVGYPAAATFNPWLARTSVAEASLTRGIISAKKTAHGGWILLQHDAATSKGSSGGPALDSSGKVIGIQTFGSLEAGEKVQGGNFIVPVSIIREFLERAGVRIEEAGPEKTREGAAKPSGADKPKPDTGDESGLEKR